ncbi:MAG: TIGR02530 family flagellar biosynthesis protein [Oscillospiraceae bacterium]
MLISELMQSRGIAPVTTGRVGGFTPPKTSAEDGGFARELQNQLDEKKRTEQNGQSGVVFSKHALERISERQIDIENGDTLERLNKAVELAGEKGSNDALVMIGSNAFIVSIKNNKVITTLSADDMQGNIFTNIDSTVIM